MSTKLGNPDYARTFLRTMAGVSRSTPSKPTNSKRLPSADKPARIATIDPAYVSGSARVIFDGEDALSGKAYSYVSTYSPTAGDRVVMIPVGTTYVIVGPLAGAGGGLLLSRREWDLQVERLFRGLSDATWQTTFAAIFADPNFNDGDVIFLRPGTYPITAPISVTRPCTIYADGPAIIDTAANITMLSTVGTNDVEIDGLTFDGPGSATYSGTSYGILGGGATWATAKTGLTVSNCHFRNIAAQCVEVQFGIRVTVEHCIFETYVRSGGMFLSSEHVKFNDNWVYQPTNGTGNPGSNCYPAAFSRNTNLGIALQPRTRWWECRRNHFFGDPFWEVIDTHGGQYGEITDNFVQGGGTGSPGANAIAIVSSADTGGVSTYAPSHIKVARNIVDSGVTTGVCPAGIAVDGAGNGTPGGFIELADCIELDGNQIIGHGRENTSTSGAVILTYTRGCIVRGTQLIEPGSNGIAVAQDNYDLLIDDTYVRDWWTSNAGFANGAISFYAANTNATVKGLTTARGTKAATLVNRCGIRMGNVALGITVPPGSNQILGTAIAINNVGAATNLRKGVIFARGAANATPALTTGFVDLAGATVTITTVYPNAVATIRGVMTTNVTTVDAVVGSNNEARCLVDGGAQNGNIYTSSADLGLSTTAGVWTATLATPGAHTIKLQVRKTGGQAATAQATHSYVDVRVDDTP
jgi:hypothetical protein